jgi:hypothetical protein
MTDVMASLLLASLQQQDKTYGEQLWAAESVFDLADQALPSALTMVAIESQLSASRGRET